MSEHEKIELLAGLINLFEGRNNHLAKFLVENGAVSDTFISRIDFTQLTQRRDFTSIGEMHGYYSSVLSETVPRNEEDLEGRLARLLEEERYEDAARLRDYMRKIRKGKR
jgi:hypothetical protein